MASNTSWIPYLHLLIPALKGTAIAGSLWSAGAMTTAHTLLPSIYPLVSSSPKQATQQWNCYYRALSNIVPRTDLTTILICGGLAYLEYGLRPQGLGWKLWATATGLMPLGWVFVWVFILAPSNKLVEMATASDSVAKEKQTEVSSLLEEFNSLMGVRMLFPWVVGGLAIWASIGL
ncbi:hypothetical protein LTR78_001113 [Recurvomyces mirabilis]|uniref:DUF1772-domain-containing protein n=1 Tax=Recurvomyces mirabilis TaxID=574656 RepID=A0AAE1C649_9PEZI|nr:hypothetical protein LTR78_001113 [Recurvomyces mirabilis]KAK5159085.1 hypothetical protein LTS14_003193 [Recurvomyces mirabilis]